MRATEYRLIRRDPERTLRESKPDWWKQGERMDSELWIKLNHPNCRSTRPFRNQTRYKKPSDYRPGKIPQNIRVWGIVTRNGREQFWWFDIAYHLYQDMEQSLIKRVANGQVLSNDQMKDLFKTHGKYIRRLAYKLYKRHHSIFNQHLSIFATEERDDNGKLIETRCEDLESLLWEAIWIGKGTNEKALAMYVGAWVRDKMERKGKYKLKFDSIEEGEILP